MYTRASLPPPQGVTLSQRRPQLSKEDVKMATTIRPAPEGPSPNPQTATGKISLFITDSERDLMLAQAIPPPSATSTLAGEISVVVIHSKLVLTSPKRLKSLIARSSRMNKNNTTVATHHQMRPLSSSDIPPDPKVGDVHKDLSSNTWWVYQRPAPDGPVPEGRVGRWQSYSGQFAFEHPDSIASTRYTWYTTGQVWRVHHNNPSPVALDIKGVKKRFHVNPRIPPNVGLTLKIIQRRPSPRILPNGKWNLADCNYKYTRASCKQLSALLVSVPPSQGVTLSQRPPQ
ncbi:hypothetical protein BT96DRAFT_948197 [Gymnopus androsaceus JB14]|uniref:Uncharacterized protein n=1 Tax=Gymnopus androsaceus JB14 TaxID=1447944 RepID=A0A6A4GPK1_9AGAR|nr:hypothetical protein BT96DRAFT_948197 [Gymnopus androsaceus JB14]